MHIQHTYMKDVRASANAKMFFTACVHNKYSVHPSTTTFSFTLIFQYRVLYPGTVAKYAYDTKIYAHLQPPLKYPPALNTQLSVLPVN